MPYDSMYLQAQNARTWRAIRQEQAAMIDEEIPAEQEALWEMQDDAEACGDL